MINGSKFKSMFNNVKHNLDKHSPELLTGIGISCGITATVLAVKATPKAMILIDEKKEELETEKLPGVEIVKTTWKCYIPAAISGTISIACIIGANSVHSRRNAAIATAYKISETAFIEYKDKVIETIGEKSEKEIRDEIIKDKIEKNPPKRSEIIITGNGNVPCYDILNGRLFESSVEKIRRAENTINQTLLRDNYVSLNDFYYELGLDGVELGEDLGWNINDGLLEVEFSSQLLDDGKPCVVIDYNVAPKYDFYKFN